MVAAPHGQLLLAADALVAGVHADLSLTGVDDLGWKALTVNLSDIAAMGGTPGHALVTVTLPPGGDLDALYDGLLAAADAFACPVVGGDLTSGPVLVVTVAVTGALTEGPPVLRRGAHPGDALLVTGPLGRAAAGLARLRAGVRPPDDLVDAHRRPVPRLGEGRAAGRGGATAMLDLSDGLAVDLRRLAEASGVGVVVEHLPVAEGATTAQALAGGDDYELLMAAPDASALSDAFAAAGLSPPIVVGTCTGDPAERRLGDDPLPEGGWEHRW